MKNFAYLQRSEFGRVRDGKEKLPQTRDSRHSSLPTPPIKRATLQ